MLQLHLMLIVLVGFVCVSGTGTASRRTGSGSLQEAKVFWWVHKLRSRHVSQGKLVQFTNLSIACIMWAFSPSQMPVATQGPTQTPGALLGNLALKIWPAFWGPLIQPFWTSWSVALSMCSPLFHLRVVTWVCRLDAHPLSHQDKLRGSNA